MNQPATLAMPAANAKLDEGKALDLLIRGFQVSRMLRVAADLCLADKIPSTENVAISDLAQASSVHPAPLLRILRALAAFGVFTVSAKGSVGLLNGHDSCELMYRTACIIARVSGPAPAPGAHGASSMSL